MDPDKNRLILASASPRRKTLLAQIGVNVDVAPADIDEQQRLGESPEVYVSRLAKEKAEAGFMANDGRPVLGADTTVALDDQVLGKPTDLADAQRILGSLSGRRHRVITSVAIATAESLLSRTVTTEVEFNSITDEMILSYWQSGEPQDKAGAYGIQGLGAVFVKRIDGSYSSVVGLPLAETAELLAQIGVPVWQSVGDKE